MWRHFYFWAMTFYRHIVRLVPWSLKSGAKISSRCKQREISNEVTLKQYRAVARSVHIFFSTLRHTQQIRRLCFDKPEERQTSEVSIQRPPLRAPACRCEEPSVSRRTFRGSQCRSVRPSGCGSLAREANSGTHREGTTFCSAVILSRKRDFRDVVRAAPSVVKRPWHKRVGVVRNESE